MPPERETRLDVRRGQEVAVALATALGTARSFDPSNAVMQQKCAELKALLDECSLEVGPVSIGVHSHCVFVDMARIPNSLVTYGPFSFLVDLLDGWGVNSLTFSIELTCDELMRALVLLARNRPDETDDLAVLLQAHDIEDITAENVLPGTGGQAWSLSPIVVYSAARQLSAELGAAQGPLQSRTIRRIRHITQAVVDEILRDPYAMLTLTTIKDFDQYLILHSINVAVLSTLLGQRLGLEKPALGELCLAGFMHDTGKQGVDPDVLNKPGALDEEEWRQMRRHPVLAAQTLLSGRHLTESDMRSVVVAFEHHLDYNLSGYPATEIKKNVSLYGGIVSIADRFDALTTARVYRKVNMTPPEAMVHVARGAGTAFDRTLVKLFVQVMGVYPAGTAVVLNRGEAGVVCRPPAVGTPIDRPQVRVMVGGIPGSVVDLQEWDGRRYTRDIVAVLNPSNKGQMPAVDPTIFTSL